MTDLWHESGTEVKTPDGHTGRLEVTRRERKLIASGELQTARVKGTDGIGRRFLVQELEVIPFIEDNDDIICPFCENTEFDKIGLKMHLEDGDCEIYNKTERA